MRVDLRLGRSGPPVGQASGESMICPAAYWFVLWLAAIASPTSATSPSCRRGRSRGYGLSWSDRGARPRFGHWSYGRVVISVIRDNTTPAVSLSATRRARVGASDRRWLFRRICGDSAGRARPGIGYATLHKYVPELPPGPGLLRPCPGRQ
jgi:CubicO group peptidase (beta-lactamase class C family)